MKNKGIIPINKPSGWTSFDICNKLKHMVKPLKVGHLGTLDPMATGVLLVTVGKATKLFDIMQEKKKTYIAEFEFGFETDTLDITGTQQNVCTYIPTLDEIQNVLPTFVGKINQIPPKYSAKNINGKRAYELARNNQEFELKPKQVEVFELNFISYNNNILKIEIVCGSGTYIRSLGRDIAYKTNSLATMKSLVRTSVGKFSIENCYNIENLSADNAQKYIIEVDNVLNYQELVLTDLLTNKLLNGQRLEVQRPNGNYCLKQGNEVLAIVKIEENMAKMSIFLG